MNWAKLFSVFALGNFLIFYQPSAAESDFSGEGEEEEQQEIPLVFGWIEKPPYATPPTNGSLDNEVQGMIRDAISPYILEECGRDWGNLEYQVATKKFESEFEMIELLRQNKVHVALPIFENPENRKYIDFPFFKLDDYHGTEFITTEDDTTALTVVMDSVLKSWPLLAVLLVLTAIAGIIMWALDTYWNSEEFPRSFIKGSWDGFWWSFISMTTVGYGDKSPKSIVARIFSIIWIMMGLIVMAIFTASVTSALTAASLDLEPSNLEGYKIAVLGNGTEYQHALLEDAHPTEYKNIEDIVQAMNTDEVDGMMLDHYTASYYQQRDKLKSFVTVTNFELRREVGLLFSEDRRFIAECFLLYRSNIWRLAQTITGTFKLKQQKSNKSVSLFDDSSLLIKQFLYTSLGILGVLVLAGMLWELFVKKKVKIRKVQVVEAVNPGFSFSSQGEAIRYDVEATRELFKQMEEHLSKLEFKVSKL